MITFAFLSHHSKELILPMVEKIISYNLNIPIIIIENSQDLTLKKELDIKKAFQLGIRLFAFDSYEELKKISRKLYV